MLQMKNLGSVVDNNHGDGVGTDGISEGRNFELRPEGRVGVI